MRFFNIQNQPNVVRPILLFSVVVFSLTVQSCTEDDEACTETVCPDGFNGCFEKPCE